MLSCVVNSRFPACQAPLSPAALRAAGRDPLRSSFLSTRQPLSNLSRCEPSWIYPFCFHILSHSFGATEHSQPLSAQSLAHSFPCNGGGALFLPLATRHLTPFPANWYLCFQRLVGCSSRNSFLLTLLHGCPGMGILHELSPLLSPPSAGARHPAHRGWAKKQTMSSTVGTAQSGLLSSRNILFFPVTPGCGIIQRAKGTANLDLAQGGSR